MKNKIVENETSKVAALNVIGGRDQTVVDVKRIVELIPGIESELKLSGTSRYGNSTFTLRWRLPGSDTWITTDKLIPILARKIRGERRSRG